MKDIITISTVNFHARWGDSADNIKRMLEYVEDAGKNRVDLIVFPETALTGYDDDTEHQGEEKMHRRLAETVPGSSTNAMGELTKKYGIYAVFGMAERDSQDPAKVYNAVAICGPQGVIGTYRKIHLPFSEMNWAERGEDPFLFDTPWGPVGVGICYDVYAFPELTRYCRAMGARMMINCTAIGTAETKGAGGYTGNLSLEYHAHNNSMYIVSSNLFGLDRSTFFMGGASIIGPASIPPHVHYYAGKRYLEPGAAEGTLETATVDLSLVGISFLSSVFNYNPRIKDCDWRPGRYMKWYQDVLQNPSWGRPKK
jgi:predicted amidohydrolase